MLSKFLITWESSRNECLLHKKKKEKGCLDRLYQSVRIAFHSILRTKSFFYLLFNAQSAHPSFFFFSPPFYLYISLFILVSSIPSIIYRIFWMICRMKTFLVHISNKMYIILLYCSSMPVLRMGGNQKNLSWDALNRL